MYGRINRVITFLALQLIFMNFSSYAWCSEYMKGLKAAQRGDFSTALQEWRPLAVKGHPKAQINLGVMYLEGRGVSKNFDTALKWFLRAGKQGDLLAQANLGLIYKKGYGVPKNYTKAFGWYQLAASRGDAESQLALGDLYERGLGISRNFIRAYIWYDIASWQGYGPANRSKHLIGFKMKPSEVLYAKNLAHECRLKNFKNC